MHIILGMGIMSTAHHKRDCPLWAFQRDYQVSMRYKFPRWLLNKVLHASFSASYGAGGCSLAPTLGILSVATENNPAFEILGKLLGATAENVDRLILEIRQLFVQGEASPFDIDTYGRDLLHVNYCSYNSLNR